MTRTAPDPTGNAPTGNGIDTRGGHSRAAWLWIAVGAAVAFFGLALGLSLGGSGYTTPPDGVPDPGPVVGWGLPVVKFLATLSGTLTIGFLTSAAFLIPGTGSGTVSRAGRRDVRRAAWSAAAWSGSAVGYVVFSNAAVLGKPLLESLDPDVFFLYAFEVPQHNAYLMSAAIAAIIALGCTITVRTGAAAVWLSAAAVALLAPAVTAHGSASGDHSLATTAGAAHALAAAFWVGGLIAVSIHIWRGDPGADTAVRRFSSLATICVIVLFVTGLANSYTRMERPADLLGTGYGVIVVVKMGLLAVLLLIARRTRRTALARTGATGDAGGASGGGHRAALLQWLVTEVLVLAATIGVATSLGLTAYPRNDVPMPSPAEELLGFPFPPPPSASTIAFGWYPDVFFIVLCCLLAGLYAAGLVRLHRRGIRWSVGRSISWFAGVLVLAWATSGGLAGYAKVSVEFHMAQHMVLAMLVPILLVLGTPATLALRALHTAERGSPDRGPREWVNWGLRSPYSRVMTQPLVVLALGTFGLYGLYFTPLFALAMGSHVGHVLMGVHFLFSGFLFYWVVLGLDPAPRQVPAWARLILLLVFVSLHGLFAIVIMSLTQPMAPEWFGLVQPPWIADLLADTADAGGLAWAFGEIPTLIVMLVVAVQWARSEERIARTHDRQADRDGNAELRAYNERLARMGERADSQQR